MGEFFDIVPPFSTTYDSKIFVFADNSVSAMHLAKMLGLSSRSDIPLKFIHKRPTKYPVPGALPVKYFVDLCDLHDIMTHFNRDPADLRKVFPKEKRIARSVEPPQEVVQVQLSAADTPQSSVEQDLAPADQDLARKRDREEEAETPDEFIKLFAKRYIKEHPDKAKEFIVEKLIKNKLDDLMKSLA